MLLIILYIKIICTRTVKLSVFVVKVLTYINVSLCKIVHFTEQTK